MWRLIRRRLIAFPIVLLGMSVITFALTHLVPGDPARLLAGAHATAAQVAQLRRQYGLDRPVLDQYVAYVQDPFTATSARRSRHAAPSLTICANSSRPRSS